MNDRDSKVLESYLGALDKALAKLSTSDRAEIITEIKGHVLDTLEREPTRSLDNVLASLGEPEAVANKYLIERGMSPGRASKTPVVKWLTIGFLGTLAMLIAFIIIAVAFFSPLIEVDEQAGRVRILGGLIKVNDSKVSISAKTSESYNVTKSELSLTPEMKFKLIFTNGKIDLESSEGNTIAWTCELEDHNEPKISEENGYLTLDLTAANGADCDITLPIIAGVEIEGTNGKVDFDYPNADTTIVLSNGKVEFELAAEQAYEHDVKVGMGVTKGFPASVVGGIKLKVDVGNGMVSAD